MESTGGIRFTQNYPTQPRVQNPESDGSAPDTSESKPPEGDGVHLSEAQIEMFKLAQTVMPQGAQMRNGESITIRTDGEKVVITKEGPDGWAKFKTAAADTSHAVARTIRSGVEADPSFAFRESLEVAKTSVERTSPPEVAAMVGKGLYPVMRGILTAVDVNKALKTRRDPVASFADKAVDIAHVATDVAGLLAITSQVTKAIPIPGAPFLAAAAVIGDMVAGAWHFLRIAPQAAKRAELAAHNQQNQSNSTTEPPKPSPNQELKLTIPVMPAGSFTVAQ